MLSAILALALQAPASEPAKAAESSETRAKSATKEDGNEASESSYLLVELIRPAKFIGFPAVCPGTSPDEDQSQVICMAELYEAPARVIEHLGGVPTKRRLNIRFTAHSFSALWRKDVRFVLGVRPFEDKGRKGHFAWSWDWENDNGEFCVTQESLADYDEPLRRFYGHGRKMITDENNDDWSEDIALRCVRGRLARRLKG